jgi:hypothetical protein
MHKWLPSVRLGGLPPEARSSGQWSNTRLSIVPSQQIFNHSNPYSVLFQGAHPPSLSASSPISVASPSSITRREAYIQRICDLKAVCRGNLFHRKLRSACPLVALMICFTVNSRLKVQHNHLVQPISRGDDLCAVMCEYSLASPNTLPHLIYSGAGRGLQR